MLKRVFVISLISLGLLPTGVFALDKNMSVETMPIKSPNIDADRDFRDGLRDVSGRGAKPNVIFINNFEIPQKEYIMRCNPGECEIKEAEDRL